ncbi:MAG: C10 family peptidase [Bacteroidota bacterium]
MKRLRPGLILSFLLLLSFTGIKAAVVSPEKASQVARNFYTEKRLAAEPKAVYSLHSERLITLSDKNIPLIYVICFDDAGGFVLVSGDDRVKPVLGYSFSGEYQENNLPPAYLGWLEQYKKEIRQIIKKNTEPKAHITKEWNNYATATDFKIKSLTAQVLPLLTTTWDQGCHYNDSCPTDVNSWSCNHVPTGCVATAIAQIMKYHAYPAHGAGQHSYNALNYGMQTANFETAAYNWASMPNILNVTNTAVAKLMYHAGVGVDMGYSTNASGAASSNAAKALVHYFQYSDSIRLLQRSDYTDAAWNAIVKHQMDLHQPIYYAGANPSEGHAFVTDGYQDTDYYHFNWGWSGGANGYFYLSNLDPGGMTFNDGQEIIVGIKPGLATPCSGTKVLTEPTGDFIDGSYTSDYTNNSDCSWLIQPNSPIAYINLEFLTFNTENTNDVVNVYNGTSNTAPLLATYSGNTIPPVITSTGSELFVEFITNGSVTKSGWSAHYETHFCFPNSTFTAAVDTITDGSGNKDYNNYTDCYWQISQPQWQTIALIFTDFETELDYDFVKVYDGTDTMAPLLGSYSGNTMPPVLYSNTSNMLIHFNADGGVTAAGWKAYYTTSVGIPELANGGNIGVYPNPAKDKVQVVFGKDFFVNTKLSIVDLEGRKIKESLAVNPQTSVSLDGVAPGVYSLVIENNQQRFVKRLVVR